MKYLKLFEEIIYSKIPIPEDVKKISNIFIENGYDLFIVGGAVRDFIIGKEPHDYDLVTNAQPASIERILKGYRLGFHGRHFAVIRVYTDETPEGIEIASYRKDIAKGRDNKPGDQKVEFGRHITIRDDVMRRDFTQNALYYNIKNEKIVDLVGGIEDIKNGIIRAVGIPRNRIREDRLRILRTFRFAARSKSDIDPDTEQAIKDDNRLNGISEIDDVSQERINEEFLSTLKWCKDRNDKKAWKLYYSFLKEYKMFYRMFPGLRLNRIYYNTFNIDIIFAKLFSRNAPNDKFHDKLVQDIRLTGLMAEHIVFLIRLSKLFNDRNIKKVLNYNNRHNNIVDLYRKKQEIGLDDETIIEYCKLSNIKSNYVNAFVDYTITTSVPNLIRQGFNGKKLGDEIRKIESEKFKDMI